ncbi:hypothetical protein M885DRAFT_564953 [Pelagophyceae sp. CCMP2097]|nr:hypothetical protein M885DRAFT_564953 [Pelagophyceae sp. CCMP2097]
MEGPPSLAGLTMGSNDDSASASGVEALCCGAVPSSFAALMAATLDDPAVLWAAACADLLGLDGPAAVNTNIWTHWNLLHSVYSCRVEASPETLHLPWRADAPPPAPAPPCACSPPAPVPPAALAPAPPLMVARPGPVVVVGAAGRRIDAADVEQAFACLHNLPCLFQDGRSYFFRGLHPAAANDAHDDHLDDAQRALWASAPPHRRYRMAWGACPTQAAVLAQAPSYCCTATPDA